MLPAAPGAVALYVTHLAGSKKVATIGRRLSAIAAAHHEAGLQSPHSHPKVAAVMAGIRRRLGVAQSCKAAILTDDLRAIVAPLGDDPLALRDRALLLIGFASAMRRSEIVSLNVGDVRFVESGLEVHLRRSKTDQEGAGRLIGVPNGSHLETCPVRALRRWLDAIAIVEGPIFRPINRHGRVSPNRLSPEAVALVVKRRAEQVGRDSSNLGAHSLRAGFVTSCAMRGISELTIRRQSGHKSSAMIERYTRPATIWDGNAASEVGL